MRRSLISVVQCWAQFYLAPPDPAQFKMISSLVEVAIGLVMAVYYFLVKLVKLCLPAAWLEKDITGQVVLVTGGGSGIGRLMCLRFARLGATVVTWDINKVGYCITYLALTYIALTYLSSNLPLVGTIIISLKGRE